MKQGKRGLLWGVVAFLLLSVSAGGGEVRANAAESVRQIVIAVEGERLNIPPGYGTPYYDGAGRLQIPMRYIIESCGYEVLWDNAARTATVPTAAGNVVITLGSKVLGTPAGPVEMNTAAVANADGRTYVPLRFVLEALGFTVTWTREEAYDSVAITGTIGRNAVRRALTPAEISAMASAAIGYVETFDAAGNRLGSGSCFFIDPSGIGVTNYHVIAGASAAVLHMPDGAGDYRMDKILYYSVERDVAVFTLSPAVSAFPHLKIALPGSVRTGDLVCAIGSPLGLANSISDGLVSSRSRIDPDDGMVYIQTTTPISPGSSGGALLNRYGEVIGITSASYSRGQNLNLAVPMSALAGADYRNAGAPRLDEVTRAEFRARLNATAAGFSARTVYENPADEAEAVQRLTSGDTVIGTFGSERETDFYRFETPIPVYLTVLAGGMPKNWYSPELDILAWEREGMSWDDYISGSLVMLVLDAATEKTVSEPQRTRDGGGHPVRLTDGVRLEPGVYYICLFSGIEDVKAWEGKSYYVYLLMEPAGE